MNTMGNLQSNTWNMGKQRKNNCGDRSSPSALRAPLGQCYEISDMHSKLLMG